MSEGAVGHLPRRGTGVARPSGSLLRSIFTDRSDGDLACHLDDHVLDRRRRRIAPTPWTWLHQVHGSDVVVVSRAGQHAGSTADAAVTAVAGATLAVGTADCAGVVLRSAGAGVDALGVAHAGWRGLVGGVLEATVEALADLGATELTFELGPCISPARYEFGEVELRDLAHRLGDSVVATTDDGRPALDLRSGVRGVLGRMGVAELDTDRVVACTASSAAHWSYRQSATASRQATVAWIETGATGR